MEQEITGAVLLVSDDADLARRVQGHAAGHGVRVLVAGTDQGTLSARAWSRAPLTLVGVDALAHLAEQRLPPHPQVHALLPGPLRPAHPERGVQPDGVALAAALRIGVRSVIGPDDGHRLGTLLAAVADPRPPGRVLVFVGARGGEGVTTLATAVALAASAGGSVALLHPDPWGPTPEHVLGSRTPTSGTLTWHDVGQVGGVLTPVALRDGLPAHRDVRVLAHPRAGAPPVRSDVLQAVVAGARNAFDVVVVDLDVRDHTLCAEALTFADRTWLVARPRALGLTAARNALTHLTMPVGRTRLLLRGAGVPDTVAARTVGLDVAHRMPDDRRLDEALDLGAGPLGGRRTPLARAAAVVLTDLANDHQQDTA